MNDDRPTLHTDRLRLRPFVVADADAVAELAGDRRVAEMTQNIPHPYPPEAAVAWIRGHPARFQQDEEVVFAMERLEDQLLIGAIGLVLDLPSRKAELGYWVGVPYWNQGYCTEAGREILRYGFSRRKLHRIQARHFDRNPASGRVMQKLGMTYEGCLRKSLLKWDEYLDVLMYSILEDEFQL